MAVLMVFDGRFDFIATSASRPVAIMIGSYSSDSAAKKWPMMNVSRLAVFESQYAMGPQERRRSVIDLDRIGKKRPSLLFYYSTYLLLDLLSGAITG